MSFMMCRMNDTNATIIADELTFSTLDVFMLVLTVDK